MFLTDIFFQLQSVRSIFFHNLKLLMNFATYWTTTTNQYYVLRTTKKGIEKITVSIVQYYTKINNLSRLTLSTGQGQTNKQNYYSLYFWVKAKGFKMYSVRIFFNA